MGWAGRACAIGTSGFRMDRQPSRAARAGFELYERHGERDSRGGWAECGDGLRVACDYQRPDKLGEKDMLEGVHQVDKMGSPSDLWLVTASK